MIDTVLYGLTQGSPGGPIIRPAEPIPEELYDLYGGSDDATPPTLGRTIGGVLSLALLLAVGAYLFIAL